MLEVNFRSVSYAKEFSIKIFINQHTMNASDNAHITIVTYVPKEQSDIESSLDSLQNGGLVVNIQHKTSTIQASIEWSEPTMIVAFIASHYFSAPIKELGKDHYELLKKWLKDQSKKYRSKKRLKVQGGTVKAGPSDDQSDYFSFYVQLPDKKLLKVFVNEVVSASLLDERLDELLDKLPISYSLEEDAELNDVIKRKNGKTLYAFVETESLSWVFLDDMEMIRRSIEQKSAHTNQ